jgi:hypothetical protein
MYTPNYGNNSSCITLALYAVNDPIRPARDNQAATLPLALIVQEEHGHAPVDLVNGPEAVRAKALQGLGRVDGVGGQIDSPRNASTSKDWI